MFNFAQSPKAFTFYPSDFFPHHILYAANDEMGFGTRPSPASTQLPQQPLHGVGWTGADLHCAVTALHACILLLQRWIRTQCCFFDTCLCHPSVCLSLYPSLYISVCYVMFWQYRYSMHSTTGSAPRKPSLEEEMLWATKSFAPICTCERPWDVLPWIRLAILQFWEFRKSKFKLFENLEIQFNFRFSCFSVF